MLNVHNLERRWLIYKIKSYLPYAGAMILLLLVVGEVWLSSKNACVSKYSQPIHTNKNSILAESPIPLPQETTMILEPSMEFVHTMSESAPAVTSLPVSDNTQPALKTVSPLPAPVPKTLLLPDSPPVVSKPLPPSSKGLFINHNESTLDITELERRFKESSNPNLGLFIARYYYDHGAYSEAYNYALKTNAINSRMDESWIIFSKSLVKLGKIDQAKKTLQFYIAQSGSDAARGLLDTIEKGNFK
jgi:Anaphase-promoting complex, cyclosome, subunit 3